MRTLSSRTSPVAVTVLVVLAGLLPGLSHLHASPVGAATASSSGSDFDRTEPAPLFDPAAPNVVLITTDDQTLQEMAYLPRTRRLLGERGVTFTRMLSPHPLCCPARAEILSGQYAQNNGVHSNGGPYGGWGALEDPDDNVGAWLQAEGYQTSLIGKFVNKWRPAQHGIPAGWSDFQTSPVDSFGYYDFSIFANGKTTDYSDDQTYSTDYVTDQTVARIRDWSQPEEGGVQAGEQRPFFVWASYYAPHGDCRTSETGCKVPPTPERKYADAYPDERAPVLDKPSFRGKVDKPNPLVKGRKNVARSKARQLHLQRVRSLISVDDGVQQIVDTLASQGVLDDTLLLFTSDNGYLKGEHRFLGKVVAYDESLRVPLLMRGPGLPRGVERREFATTVDLAPTIAAAAGADPGRVVDGRDLVTVAQRRAAPVDTVLIQAGTAPNKAARSGRRWMYRGVRTSRWTYTKWLRGGGNRYVELFDNRRDPHQLDNLADDRGYRRVEKELRARTRALSDCAGPTSCFRRFGQEP